MGDRGNIKIGDIYLYTHWTGSNLLNTLRNALIRGESRWEDECYLTRIIFSEMIQEEVLDTTGYGISTEETDTGVLIVVDVEKQTIETEEKTYTFEEFIKNGI